MMTFSVPKSTMIEACCKLQFNSWKASTNFENLNTSSALRATTCRRQDIHICFEEVLTSRIQLNSGGPSTNIKEDRHRYRLHKIAGHSKTPSQQRHKVAMTHGLDPSGGNVGMFRVCRDLCRQVSRFLRLYSHDA